MSEWISADKYPIEHEDLMRNGYKYNEIEVIGYDGERVMPCFFKAGCTVSFWGNFSVPNITHWMHYPKAPE